MKKVEYRLYKVDGHISCTSYAKREDAEAVRVNSENYWDIVVEVHIDMPIFTLNVSILTLERGWTKLHLESSHDIVYLKERGIELTGPLQKYNSGIKVSCAIVNENWQEVAE